MAEGETYALCVYESDGTMTVLRTYEAIADLPGGKWHKPEPIEALSQEAPE